jgi:carbohydrate diacid regulator
VHETFHDSQDVVGAIGRSHIAVLHRLRGDDLPEVGRRAAATVGEAHGPLLIGLGGSAAGVAGLRDSHADALAAVRLAARSGDRAVRVADIADHRVHQLLATVGVGARDRFTGAVLGELPDRPDWDALRDTLLTWAEHGFHLVRTAEALHVHRNTLVYRLQKIESILGRALRDHRHAITLYLACLLQGAARPPNGDRPARG